MKKFKFEIQNCIEIEVSAESKEDARMMLVEDQSLYEDEMCGQSCWISDGEEIK